MVGDTERRLENRHEGDDVLTLKEFHSHFDAAGAAGSHVGCRQCGLVGRAGCRHLVTNFAPERMTITGVVMAGGSLTMAPRRTSMRLGASGQPLRTPDD
jgi:hypothetical protein